MTGLTRAFTVPAVLLVVLVFVASPADATFPGTNGRIAFSTDTGRGGQINTIEPNGEGLQQISSVTGTASDSDWSPDGTKIAFDVDTSADPGVPCRIEMMDADGGNVVDLTPTAWVQNGGCAYNPSFTPDGKHIVFVATRCEGDEIGCPGTLRSMNLDGDNRRRILRVPNPGSWEMHSPEVSPDGRTILITMVDETVVMDGVHGNRKALYTVRMNGSHLTKVTSFRLDVCVCSGDWAPSGDRIVSSSQAGPTPVPGVASNLFTVRPHGTGLRFLMHSTNTDVGIGVGSYSPNGHWILYKRIREDKGRYRLMKIHPSGEAAILIAAIPANPAGRDWGPLPS